MTVVDSTRRLLGSFRNRNVVYVSKAFINSTNVMLVQFELDFGKNGMIRRRCVLDFKAVQGIFDTKIFDVCYKESVSRLAEHIRRMEELQRVFKETIEWTESDQTGTFLSQSVGDEPFFIHVLRKNKDALLELFGRGIEALNLGVEGKSTQGKAECLNRLHEIVTSINDHLFMVKGLNVYDIMVK